MNFRIYLYIKKSALRNEKHSFLYVIIKRIAASDYSVSMTSSFGFAVFCFNMIFLNSEG